MNDQSATDAEAAAVRAAVARLRASVIATVVGFFSGAALAVATLWLVIQDGPNVGQHLILLGNYFPGYTVSPWGALVGFAYAAVLGAAVGWCATWVYNRAASSRTL